MPEETSFLERAGGRIAYDDAGAGPLVIAVPSLGDIRQEYRQLRQRLIAAGFRVVTMDLRGHGESSAGWNDYRQEAIGDDILALIDALDAGPATIIGTSYGAGAAVWAAAEAPDRVCSLVLIGPFVRAIPPSLLQQVAMKVLFRGPWKVRAWAWYYGALYPTAKPSDFDRYRRRLSAMLQEPGRFAALQAMLDAPRDGVEARLADVRVPVLVVMGTKDPDFPDPAAEAALVAERIQGQVALIDGAGHYPHAELPDQTADVILRFLQGHPPGGPVASS
ncbi:MAG: hydrolase [Dehalococcoidia bacterium]|nr:MAG: hydrolase [Dehalococcoidia bacterium]